MFKATPWSMVGCWVDVLAMLKALAWSMVNCWYRCNVGIVSIGHVFILFPFSPRIVLIVRF